ncbi:MAG: FHA domain-containing protein [Planctomycetaceae bacterium]
MPEFIIQSGKHSGKKLLLDNAKIVIGRDDICQIRISSKDVSRQHCVIQLTESGWVVRDLGSQNGTYVNGVHVESDRGLDAGDTLRVGPMVLQFSDPDVSTAQRKSRPRDNDTTDDDIVGWLAETGELASSGDTTIISTPVQQPAVSDDTSTTTPTLPQPQRTFQSIGEEAADIIRRHRQMVEDQAE